MSNKSLLGLVEKSHVKLSELTSYDNRIGGPPVITII